MPLFNDLQNTLQKAEEVAQEKNRALKAAMNAELRKSKAFMLEDTVPKLEKLVKKGKGVTKEKAEERIYKVRLCTIFWSADAAPSCRLQVRVLPATVVAVCLIFFAVIKGGDCNVHTYADKGAITGY